MQVTLCKSHCKAWKSSRNYHIEYSRVWREIFIIIIIGWVGMSRPDSKSPALWRLLCSYCWNIVQQELTLAWISMRVVYTESSVWDIHVWAVTRGFGTFCSPSRLSSNEHAQPSSLMSVQNLRLVLYFVCVNIEGDRETVRMHRRAWVFGVHICYTMNIEDLTWLAISYEM